MFELTLRVLAGGVTRCATPVAPRSLPDPRAKRLFLAIPTVEGFVHPFCCEEGLGHTTASLGDRADTYVFELTLRVGAEGVSRCAASKKIGLVIFTQALE